MLSKRVFPDLSPEELEQRQVAFNNVRPTSAMLQTDPDGKQFLYLAGWDEASAAAVVLLLQSGVPPAQVEERLVQAKVRELQANLKDGAKISDSYTGRLVVNDKGGFEPIHLDAAYEPGLSGVPDAAAPVFQNAPGTPQEPADAGLDQLLAQRAGNTQDPRPGAREAGVGPTEGPFGSLSGSGADSSGYLQEEPLLREIRQNIERRHQEVMEKMGYQEPPELAPVDPSKARTIYGYVSNRDYRRLVLAAVMEDLSEDDLVGKLVVEGLEKLLTNEKIIERFGA